MLPFCAAHHWLVLRLGQLMFSGLPVVITQTAMFGDFGTAGRVDDAQIRSDNDIWHGGVFGRVAVTKIRESLP